MAEFTVRLRPQARKMLLDVTDLRARARLAKRIDELAEVPEQQGKPLTGDLIGYRSIRAVGQRYRVIYRVEQATVIVVVVAIGLRKEGDRKDVYALAQKLLHLGLLDPPLEDEP